VEKSPDPQGSAAVRYLRRTFPPARLIRIGIGIVALIAAAYFILYLGDRGIYNVSYATGVFPKLLTGLPVTLELIGTVIPVGFCLGLFFGWARTTRSAFLRGFGATYVEFFRGMPPLALIFFSFLISTLVLLQLTHNPFVARNAALWIGVLALGLHSGAYQAEIIRAGLLSVPTGQLEAADAIGMSRFQSAFRVVLPQAFRVSLPAIGNEFSSVIKDTSLLNLIGWYDLIQLAILNMYAGFSQYVYAPLIIWLWIAIIYFIITFAVNRTVRAIENTFKVPGLEAAEL
jgi:His/Glu/Gln/Arg/opine family amino acid ABC transporter permease subunit